jgi:hypothetical protein
LLSISFELMETRDLTEERFRPRRGGVENRDGPFDMTQGRPFDRLRVDILRRMPNLRASPSAMLSASMANSLALVITRQ